jgi:hypothetical protein
MPFTRFTANQAWMEMILAAADLLTWLQPAVPGRRACPGRAPHPPLPAPARRRPPHTGRPAPLAAPAHPVALDPPARHRLRAHRASGLTEPQPSAAGPGFRHTLDTGPGYPVDDPAVGGEESAVAVEDHKSRTVGPRPSHPRPPEDLRRARRSQRCPRSQALWRSPRAQHRGPVDQSPKDSGLAWPDAHGGRTCSSRLFYSGPEMPPSLRTRQKWMAMKITMRNGNSSTCSTYQRNSVSVPISVPPTSTNRTWSPNTGV